MSQPGNGLPSGPPSGPLGGLLVVDFTRVLAGPFATMMLSDLGARVVKVERPEHGDDSRSYGPFSSDGRSFYFARVNRGKQSIALDLKSRDDVALARALCTEADVVVENYRPGVMDRLGLGAAAVLEGNPRVVYCSISGFGHTGPWSQRPAYDAVVQGMSGLVHVTGMPGEAPVKPGIPVADLSAGMYAYGAICSALLGVARTGHGTHLDLAMFDATISLLEGAGLAYLSTGRDPQPIGNAHASIAPFDSFACADHEIMICAANDSLFQALCQALGLDLAADPRYGTNALRHEHREVLKPALEAALRTAPRDTWLARLDAAGVPCGPISSVPEALASEQTAVRRMVIHAGGLPLPGNPVKSSGYDDPLERPAAPTLDEHGAAIRAEFLPEQDSQGADTSSS